MSEELIALRELVEAEFAEVMTEAGESRADVAAALTKIRASVDEAMAAGDVEHVRKLVEHEIPATLTLEGLEVRESTREKIKGLATKFLSALFTVATKRIAPVLLLAVLLPTVFGCAVMKKGAVPTPTVKGTLGDVCEVAERCADAGRIDALPSACDTERAGSLINDFATEKTVDGARMLVDVTAICAQVDRCLIDWPDLPEYKARDYSRWCGLLQGIASAAQ